jgi:hypothetical protein
MNILPFAASDLKITRKVGNDGLVIAWLPSPDSECVGYLVIQKPFNKSKIKRLIFVISFY